MHCAASQTSTNLLSYAVLVSLIFYRCVCVCVSVLKVEAWKNLIEPSPDLYGRRRNPVNTNRAEHFLLLTTLWFPLNALFRIAIACHFPLSYTQNQHHTAEAFLPNSPSGRIYRTFTCCWNLSRLTAQSPRARFTHRTGVWPGSWAETSPPPPRPFSAAALAGLPLDWEGEQLQRTFFLRLFPSAREDWLALKTASIWQLQIAASMSTRFIHIPHRGIRKPRTHWWFPWFYGSPLPPGLQHIFGSCVQQCPGICSVGNLNWEPIAPRLLPIKMCKWISHACFKHRSRRDLQATV